jgi:catechol 2,3-dioxygenase-like lactoylglutathione lyase family enzyme
VIDHFNLPVLNLARSRAFYEEALVPLGLGFLAVDGGAIGFGKENWEFGIVAASVPLPRIHLAFQAPSRAAVNAFFSAAFAAGGIPNGPPGIRAQYDSGYYAAFVLDPDGHNIEAVFRGRRAV